MIKELSAELNSTYSCTQKMSELCPIYVTIAEKKASEAASFTAIFKWRF